MSTKKLFRNHDRTHRNTRCRTHALCEALEPRRLLTQFTFNVPPDEGYTSVYL